MKFLSYKRIELGKFVARQYTIFEFKSFISAIFYYFEPTSGWQDRFHSHAFNAISIRFFGDYLERFFSTKSETCDVCADKHYEEKSRSSHGRFYYIPRDHAHMLGQSNGCLVLVLAGPWLDHWYEWKNGIKRTLLWGRRTSP